MSGMPDLSEQAFLEELRRDFVLEAEEHLQTIVSGLIELEENPGSTVIEAVYRAAHSLKGAAHAVQLPAVAALCQPMESVFSGLKSGFFSLERKDFDLLQRSIDAVAALVAGKESAKAEDCIKELERLAAGRKLPGTELPRLENILPASRDISSEERMPPRPLSRAERPTPPEQSEAPPAHSGGVAAAPPAPPFPTRASTKGSLSGTERRPRGDEVVQPRNAVVPSVPERRNAPDPSALPRRAEGVPAREGKTGEEIPLPKLAAQETIRIAAAKLDALFLQAEELLSVKLSLQQRLADLEELLSGVVLWREEWEKTSLRLWNALSPAASAPFRDVFADNRTRLADLEERLRRLRRSLRADQTEAGTLVQNLLEGAKTVLMLPFGAILQGFPKIVRDLSGELGKDVETEIRGSEVEVDKRILEGIKDPLIHLVRNAVDHGMETPEARTAAGKPPRGTLAITVSRASGGRVEVCVTDDGSGIDPEKVREKAVRMGIVSAEEAGNLDDRAALLLIFRSGFSTSRIITGISGRGLGMAIVQEGVEKLGGSVAVESTPGAGTTFRLSLPLTLATLRGLLVEEAGRLFVVPTANVERVARIPAGKIKTVGNRDTVFLDGRPLVFRRLGEVLGTGPAPSRAEPERRFSAPGGARRETSRERKVSLLVVRCDTRASRGGEHAVAFEVERILGEQEILFKNLGPQLRRVRNVAGATVLGSGDVALVLSASDLIRSALGSGAALSGRSKEAHSDGRAGARRVLLAEDSITSRTLLRNVLASAGFEVRAVVDGMEAWNALEEEPFDVVVSDVEMPRLGGFDLTARIRSEPRFAHLPVVLVTSLESREDRERGVSVGADAYIVKSSFDQEHLLEVVRRLV
ncbi:hybrid sensor histidine kinase/response regulator [Aminiphilus circumscriptus]|uniref:hybrid sensor histidine kinase/response regulator n=1 Tax=Aminiphilus circumscriptus TaxID=290732 RepID=UPI0004785BDE|nr:hybrid sensor histidine kinase/response regulator [Aminiphilus circumscriptus]